nr:hypothetical protein [Tanacetum cinerariifolium]
TTNSEDVEGRPLFNRFAKADSMKAVPLPLSGDYTSLSDHIDLDESQMSYGTKSSTSSDSKSVSNDFVSCDDSDKSSEVNTNDFAFSDFSVKSSEPKPNDSTSYASTSNVSTSENEAEIKSNVRIPIQEPIIVEDLPSFSCNSSDKNENTSRTSCNKNGYFNKKAGHFRKHASSVSKLCFVCGSGTHFIKDCDFYGKQMVNKTIGIRNKVNHQTQFVPQAVLLRTGKVNIPSARPQPVYWQLLLSPQQVVLGNHIEKICDKKNQVLFIDTESLVLSKDFKIPDDSMVVLRVPRKHNLYTINLNNICPRGNLACLVTNTSVDKSMKWNRRMGHVNYKNMNRLVKGNLVRGLPPKLFKNDHTCVACCKGKQHKASYKAINAVSSVIEPLQLLHKDLFEHKDETYPILKDFINLVENQLNKKVKAMRCDNGVRTACYVLNRVLVTSPHNKTPYALLTRNIPSISLFRPFGCHVTILNTSDHLGKFDGKADEGYIIGYSGLGHEWYFNLDYLTDTLGYKHVQANQSAGTQEATTNPAGTEPKDTSGDEVDDSSLNSADDIFQTEFASLKGQEQRAPSDAASLGLGFANDDEELQKKASAKTVPPGSILIPSGDTMVSADDVPVHNSSSTDSFFDDEPTLRFPSPSDLGNHDPSPGIFSSLSYDDEFGAALNNVACTVEVSLVRDNHTDFQHCLFACFLSQVEPSSVAQALEDPIWVDAMQEEMQQFKFQNVWVLVDLPEGKYAIRTKWILKNKRDARGIVVRNKARLVAQGYRQEEGIDYNEVFALVARIEAIRLFLAFASYMEFMVYQMDVKSAFLYGRIDKE